MELIISQILNAVMLACTYTLVGIGFSLFFGAMDIVVFCLGDVAIAGAFAIMALSTVMGVYASLSGILPAPISGIIVVFIGACFTAGLVTLMYRAVIVPFEGKNINASLLSTIAAGIVIRELIGLFYPEGRNPHAFPQLLPAGLIGDNVLLSWRNIIIIAITFIMVMLLYWFVNRTKTGLSIQAISQNKEAAIMVGINWHRIIVITFLIGGFLLGIGGFLTASYFNSLRFDMGAMYGLKGFCVAVVGGLGSIYGAIVGGLLIAFVEVFVTAFIPGGTAYSSVAAFLIVVLFILFKPEGILGEKTVEKV
ncbi:MAG: branched-chain amino acid transport system permease protein [Clostridia bacterium]|nr:branched-chain amino acid transport system permease protein [Clostridia bacterium]